MIEPDYAAERGVTTEKMRLQRDDARLDARRAAERLASQTTNGARRRAGRVGRDAQKYRAKQIRRDGAVCEACAWTPPAGMKGVLQVHHVVPISCGGDHADSNLLLVCPNCHAIAHKITRIVRVTNTERDYEGPVDKTEMLAALQMVTSLATSGSQPT